MEAGFSQKISEIDFEEALIDIPIGLPEESIRECDQKARNFLAPERHYSTFSCPKRNAVYAETYEEACNINEERTGKRISKQACLKETLWKLSSLRQKQQITD